MENRTAYIFVCNRYAGRLNETEEGYSFRYDEDYLTADNPLPVSLTLPLKQGDYSSKTLFSFFDGLIPEGWLLNLVTHNWKIDVRDRFGLLLAACVDPIGNVSVRRSPE